MGGYYTPKPKLIKVQKIIQAKVIQSRKSESGDTGSHQKRHTMRTTTKSGKKLKKPTYKYKPNRGSHRC